MNFNIHTFQQRSPEWYAARVGRLTSSRADAMLSELKSGKGESAGRRNLRMLLVLERVTGRPQERGFQSSAMQYGADKEEAAYAAYEALTGELLTRTGFLSHTSLMVGASLDGHVGNFDGLIEIKAPLPATHWEYLKSGKVPTDYYRQVLHSLWLTGAKWCDWMSFCDEFPANLQAKIVRVERNDAEVSDYEKKALAFLAEVDAEVNAVQTLGNLTGQLEASIAV